MTQGDPKKIQQALREFYDHYEGPGKVSDDDLEGLAERYAGKEGDMWKELYGHYEPSGVGDEVIVDLTTRYSNPYAEKKKEQTPSPDGGVPSPSGGTGSPKVTENVLGLSYGTPSPVARVSPVKPKLPPAGPALKPRPPVAEQPEEKPGRVKSALSDVMMGAEEVAAGSLKGLAIAWERGDVSKDEIFEEFKKKRGAEFEGQDEKAKQAFYEVLFTANEEAKKDGRNPAGIPFSGGMVNRKQWGERIPVSAYPELAKYDKTGVLKDVVGIYNEKLMKGIEENPLYKYAEKDIKMMQERYPTNPEFREEFLTSKLPRGFGSLIGFAGAGAASSAVMIPPWIAPTLLGSMSNASSEFDAALKKTGDPQKALEAFDSGKFVGMLEGVPFTKPFGSLFGKLSKGFKSAIAKGGLQAVANGTEEGLQEFITDVFNNSNAQEIYDATRELISKETWESGAIGFITGAILGGISAKRSTATPEEAKILDKAEAEIKAKGAEVMQERADELAKKENPTEAEVGEAEEIGKVMGQEAQGAEQEGQRDLTTPDRTGYLIEWRDEILAKESLTEEDKGTLEFIERRIAEEMEADAATAEEQAALPDEEGITPSTEVTPEVATEAPVTTEVQPIEPGAETTPAEPVAPVVPTERITAETPLEEIELTAEDVQEMVRGGDVSAMQAGMALEALETGDETMLPVIEVLKEKKRSKYADAQSETAGLLVGEGAEGSEEVRGGDTQGEEVAREGVVQEAQGQEEVAVGEEDVERNIFDWRDKLWEGVKEGKKITDKPYLYRAMSKEEYENIKNGGETTPQMGEKLVFVTDDIDRISDRSGSYGGKKEGGVIVRIKNKSTSPIESRTVRGLEEKGVERITNDDIVSVWDAKSGQKIFQTQEVTPDEKKEEPVTPKRRITSKKPTLKPKKDGKDKGQDRGVEELPSVRPEERGIETGVEEREAVRGEEAEVKPFQKDERVYFKLPSTGEYVEGTYVDEQSEESAFVGFQGGDRVAVVAKKDILRKLPSGVDMQGKKPVTPVAEPAKPKVGKKATPKKKDAVVTEDEEKKNTAQERPEQPVAPVEAPEPKPQPKAGDVLQTKTPMGREVEYRYTEEGWKFKDSRGIWQKETPQTQKKLTEEWGKTQVPKSEQTRDEKLAKAKEEFWQLGRDSIKPGMGIDPWKAFEMTAKAFEIGALLVEKGIADFATFVKALRKQFPDNLDWVEANSERLWNAPTPRFVDAQKRSLAELAKVVSQDVPEGAEREGGKPRVSKVFKNLDRTALPESVKREIRAKGGEYIPRGLEMTEEDAKLLIEDLGEQWARTQVMSDDSKVMGATRTALLFALIDIDNKKIEEFKKSGNSAGLLMAETAQADLYARARAIATRAGQEVNSFKLLYKFPTDRIAQVAVAERRQAQRDAVDSNRQSYDATVDEAYRIAQEAADKAVNEVTARFERMLAERDAEIERLSKSGKPGRKQKGEKVIAKIQSWIDAIDKSNPDGAVYDITSLLAVGAKEAVKLGLKAVQQSIRIGASVADAIDAGVKAMRSAGHDIDETLFRAKMGEILKDYDPASDKDVRKGMRDLVEAPKEGETTEDKKKRVAKATKKIRDAVKKAYGPEADGRTLTEVLIDDLGMDGDLAQIFATQIQKQFAKEVEMAKAQMDRAKDRAKGIRSGALDKMLDRMAQVDAGTMTEAEAVTAFAEDMGVAGFTPRQKLLIRTLSNSIRLANERLMAAQQAMAQPSTASNRKQFNQAMAQYNAAQRQVIQLTQQLANAVADRPGWGDMVKMILQGTLLTPRSVGINIFANALQQTTIRMPIQLVSSGLAYIMHKAAGLPRLGSIQAGNAGYWMGAKPGLTEGVSNAMKGTSDAAFVTGEAQPTMQPYEAWRKAIAGYTKEDWNSLSDLNNRAKDFVEMTYGVPMDFMFRLLEVGDRPFQRAAEMAQAMRIADEKGLYKTPKQVQKMTPAERAQHFADLGKFLSDPDPASQKRITEAGLRATFKKGDVLASALLKIAQVGQKSDKIPTVVKQVAGQIAKALTSPIAPYINIPANLLEWQIKLQMPYLAGMKALHHAEKFRKTRDNAELEKSYNELGIALIGLSIRGVAALLAAYVAPSSDDPEEMDEKIAGYSSQPAGTFNWSAYMRGDNSSYRPGDIYFTTQKLGLLGNMLQARADFKQDIARNPGDDFFPMDEVYQAMGVSKAFINNSFMRNVQSAMTGLQRGDLSRSFLTEYMNTLMTITVPGGNTTSQFALSARKDRVSKPGLKELPWSQRLGALWRDKFQPNPDDLPKIIGLDGKPVAQNESDKYAVNLLNNMFDFLGIKKVTDDPYAYKLVKFFKESGNNKDVLPPSVAREDKNKVTGRREIKFEVDGEEAVMEATPKMHESLEMAVMQARWNLWQALSDSDNWEEMSDEDRVDALKKIWKEGRESGMTVWKQQVGLIPSE